MDDTATKLRYQAEAPDGGLGVCVPIHACDEYVLERAGFEQVVAKLGDVRQIEIIAGHLLAVMVIYDVSSLERSTYCGRRLRMSLSDDAFGSSVKTNRRYL